METNRNEELFGELPNDVGDEVDETTFARAIDSRSHSFNIGDARKYGVECAVILANIRFWCDHNLARSKNLYEGYSWVYNSIKSFSLLFPYFSERQIANKLSYLEQQGALISGNFNKMKYDRTKWYTTPEHTTKKGISHLHENVSSIYPKCQMNLPKMSNEFTQNVEPIPDINTDINTDIKEYSSFLFEEFYKEYPSVRKNGKTKPKALWLKLSDEVQAQILEDVRRRKVEHRDWLEQQGKFIPAPEVYLRNEHWNRPIISSVEQTSNIYKIR